MVSRAQRKEQQLAFVLHSYPYSETSLLVEVFTPTMGRMALLARGARRPRSELRGVLRAFQPLRLSWTGGGDVKTLMKAEWQGGMAPPPNSALMSAFYLNELLLRFLPREDAHPQLFEHYEIVLRALAGQTQTAASTQTVQAALLRQFELALLTEMGYAMHLTHEVPSNEPVSADGEGQADDGNDGEAVGAVAIQADRLYHYVYEDGPCAYDPQAYPDAPCVRGATLMALASGNYPDTETAGEARRLMAQVLDHFLDDRRLFSRHVARELWRLKEKSKEYVAMPTNDGNVNTEEGDRPAP